MLNGGYSGVHRRPFLFTCNLESIGRNGAVNKKPVTNCPVREELCKEIVLTVCVIVFMKGDRLKK